MSHQAKLYLLLNCHNHNNFVIQKLVLSKIIMTPNVRVFLCYFLIDGFYKKNWVSH